MFDQLEASSIQDRVSDALYKWRRIAEWPEAEATVLEVYENPDREMGPQALGYQVFFSYPTHNGIERGRFGINGVVNAPPYQPGQTFTLRYNRRRPSRFYYASERSGLERAMLIGSAVAIGALAAFIMCSLFP
jgi:hypothetical protein